MHGAALQESTDRMQRHNFEDLADRKSGKLYLSIRLNRLAHRQQNEHLTQARKMRISPKKEFIGLPHYEKIEQVITATTLDCKKHHKVHSLHKMRTCEVDHYEQSGVLQGSRVPYCEVAKNQVSFCAKTVNC